MKLTHVMNKNPRTVLHSLARESIRNNDHDPSKLFHEKTHPFFHVPFLNLPDEVDNQVANT